MNLLLSNFLSCLQWQWVPSKAVAPSAVFAYLGLSGDICLHYQPSPLFPYVRLTTYRREPKCSSGGKENMKLTQLGDLSFFQFIDVFTKAKVNDFVSITNHVPPLPLRTAHCFRRELTCSSEEWKVQLMWTHWDDLGKFNWNVFANENVNDFVIKFCSSRLWWL